jgi:hypothetical protein
MAVLKTALMTISKKLQPWSFFMSKFFELRAVASASIKKPKTRLELSNNNF